jgi:prepilin-type N-terminal cleavage/methylation domain-containing protein
MKIIYLPNHADASKKQRGFTLVELLLVMALFSIMMLVMTDMFTSVFNVQAESKSRSSVTEDGRFIMSRLNYDIGRASAITTPENLNVGVSGVTSTTATVTWTTVDTSNSQVQYGTTTAYGSTANNASMVTAHSVNLTGLTASTTYNFRVISQNAAGIITTSVNYTFSTSGASITHVQTAAITDDNFAGSISRAFSSSNTAGNTIVAAFSWGYSFTPSCSDSQGNTYTVVTNQFDNTNSQSLAICYATNIKAGANTVTATFDGDIGFRRLIIHEYSGIVAASPVDVTASNIANGTTAANNITSTAATTTVNGDLIFGATMDDAGTATITAGTGFTQRNSVNNKDLVTQDLVQGTAGSIASTMTFGTAHRYLAQMVAFKAASSGIPASLGATSSKLTMTVGGNTYTYALSGTNLRLTTNLGTDNLNGSDTNVSNLSFQRIGNIGGKDTIRVSFTVTSKTQPKQGPRQQTFTITGGRR